MRAVLALLIAGAAGFQAPNAMGKKSTGARRSNHGSFKKPSISRGRARAGTAGLSPVVYDDEPLKRVYQGDGTIFVYGKRNGEEVSIELVDKPDNRFLAIEKSIQAARRRFAVGEGLSAFIEDTQGLDAPALARARLAKLGIESPDPRGNPTAPSRGMFHATDDPHLGRCTTPPGRRRDPVFVRPDLDMSPEELQQLAQIRAALEAAAIGAYDRLNALLEQFRDKHFGDCTKENDFDVPDEKHAAYLCLNNHPDLVPASVVNLGRRDAVTAGSFDAAASPRKTWKRVLCQNLWDRAATPRRRFGSSA